MSQLSKKVIGITGNIASGKSSVTKIFNRAKYDIIDADLITNEIYQSDEQFKNELVNLLGENIIENDYIIKSRVASLVFNSPSLLQELNRIIHPKIISIIENRVNESNVNVVVDAALLFELDLARLCDCVVFIYVASDIQIERLMSRNDLSYDDAKKRIDIQVKQEEKMIKADYIIDNSFSYEILEKNVVELINKIERGN